MKSSESIISIGRSDSNTFTLSAGSVSRRHCVLIREDERWSLVDLGSTIGTYVGEKKIIKTPLYPGIETIRISDIECRLILGQA